MVQISNDKAMKLIASANALVAQASLLSTEILACISDQPKGNELVPTLRKSNDLKSLKKFLIAARKQKKVRKAKRAKRVKKAKVEEAPKTEEAK